jgi:hypothetical protein
MPGDPHSGSKVWKPPDREIGKPMKMVVFYLPAPAFANLLEVKPTKLLRGIS